MGLQLIKLIIGMRNYKQWFRNLYLTALVGWYEEISSYCTSCVKYKRMDIIYFYGKYTRHPCKDEIHTIHEWKQNFGLLSLLPCWVYKVLGDRS